MTIFLAFFVSLVFFKLLIFVVADFYLSISLEINFDIIKKLAKISHLFCFSHSFNSIKAKRKIKTEIK